MLACHVWSLMSHNRSGCSHLLHRTTPGSNPKRKATQGIIGNYDWSRSGPNRVRTRAQKNHRHFQNSFPFSVDFVHSQICIKNIIRRTCFCHTPVMFGTRRVVQKNTTKRKTCSEARGAWGTNMYI